jgi:hypothetical protein
MPPEPEWTEKKALVYLRNQEIEKGLTLDSVWRHWKNGGTYQVVLFTLDEVTGVPLVHYQSLERPQELPWTRPVPVFLETVKSGLDWIARFRREDA